MGRQSGNESDEIAFNQRGHSVFHNDYMLYDPVNISSNECRLVNPKVILSVENIRAKGRGLVTRLLRNAVPGIT